MKIRRATFHDAPTIKGLMAELGYKTTIILLIEQIEKQSGEGHHQFFVCELNNDVLGFIAVYFIPQITSDGGLAIISYLSVENIVKNQLIANALEEYICKEARKRNCDSIQVRCMDWRTPVQQFYVQKGYQEYPKYFTKRLIYAE